MISLPYVLRLKGYYYYYFLKLPLHCWNPVLRPPPPKFMQPFSLLTGHLANTIRFSWRVGGRINSVSPNFRYKAILCLHGRFWLWGGKWLALRRSSGSNKESDLNSYFYIQYNRPIFCTWLFYLLQVLQLVFIYTTLCCYLFRTFAQLSCSRRD